MPKKNPFVDQYINKSAEFARPILEHLRSLVHKACPEAEEVIKWGFPNFDYKGPLCSMAAFKQHCTFGFGKAALIKNLKIDKRSGFKNAMGHLGRITSLKDLPSDREMLAYLKEAVRLNDAGIKLPKKKSVKETREIHIPEYFLKILKKSKAAFTVFNSFSYSHKKEYIEWITEAKTEETRNKRMTQTIEWLSEGKTRNWKYK